MAKNSKGHAAGAVRRLILQQHGVYPKHDFKGGFTTRMPKKRVNYTINAGEPVLVKRTTLMRYAEDKYGKSIERLIREGSLDEVAELLDIDRKTVLNWRRRLGLAA